MSSLQLFRTFKNLNKIPYCSILIKSQFSTYPDYDLEVNPYLIDSKKIKSNKINNKKEMYTHLITPYCNEKKR